MLYHHLILATVSIKNQFKTWLEYRTDYIAGLIGVILEQVITLSILGGIFANVSSIKNWTFPEMLVIYGFTRTSLGIADAITENLWWVSSYAKDGTLTNFLLKPIGVLYQLIFERIHFERFANSFIGIIFIVYGTSTIGYHWNILDIIITVYFVFLGVLIYLGLMIISSAIGIFFVGNINVMDTFLSLTEFAKYPVTIFNRYMIILFNTIVPISVVGYYPTAILLKSETPFLNIQTIIFATVITSIFFFFSLIVWTAALKTYQGVGT